MTDEKISQKISMHNEQVSQTGHVMDNGLDMQHNIRGLVQDLSERFDDMSDQLRQNSEFAGARPADAKTFMLISRHPRGLTELAKALKISRQAAHKSIQRLVEIGVITFDYMDGSQRDKVAEITEKGQQARGVARQIVQTIEAHIEQKIGHQDLEKLREILIKLNAD